MLNKASRFWKRRKANSPSAQMAARLIARGDAARDRLDFPSAAIAYEEALAIVPTNAAIHIQCGHMLKESGNLTRAEDHYKRAQQLTPNDADLALQMGHLYKVARRAKDAEAAYSRAVELAPDWALPAAELAMLHATGFRGRPAAPGTAKPALAGSLMQPRGGEAPQFETHAAAFGLLSSMEGLAPEVAPRHPRELTETYHESVMMQRFGRSERTRWGMRNTLRGIEALRGYCISAAPIVKLEMLTNGLVFHAQGPLEGVPLRNERDTTRLRKYFFNIWYDFTAFAHGRYDIEIRLTDVNQFVRVHHEFVVIAEALSPEKHPTSDGIVSISYDDPRSVEEQINAMPSMVRSTQRSILAAPPRNVLVVRVDQLGDMVCSIPALRRLRELLPDARLVGLIAPANVEFEATLNLFDEVIAVDFPDDPIERRRIMPLAMQHELRRKLAPYNFDLAMDMSVSEVSRPLLLLSGAPFLYGLRMEEFKWLSAGFEGITRDFSNESEVLPHSAKMMGLVEWLGIMLKNHATVVRRPDLTPAKLAKYGLAESDRFVVFHTGARIVFSRWPYYDRLAAMVLQRTRMKVVMLTDDPALRARLPAELTGSDRFQLLDQRLAFEDFDTLVSYCSAFVGNDSGPKHLAALRGANVVSIHCARNNWNEWGQENKGYIISRKVPCAGCQIHHDSEDCGKDFVCVRNISADEVYGAISEFL